jgi:hypothetical protein
MEMGGTTVTVRVHGPKGLRGVESGDEPLDDDGCIHH